MAEVFDASPSQRPLLSRKALFGLSGVAALVFLGLLPLTQARERRARTEAPSALSLEFLRIALHERPADLTLRLDLARAASAAMLFDEARAALEPLLAQASTVGDQARRLRVELEHRAWAAAAEATQERAVALSRLLSAIREAGFRQWPAEQVLWLAQLAGEAEQSALRAELLGFLARRGAPAFKAYGAQAEAAYLASGQPLEAAKLIAENALETRDEAQALRALETARSADRPSETRALLAALVRAIPTSLALQESSLGAALEQGDLERALPLAEQLQRAEPDSPERSQRLTELLLWSGRALRATRVQAKQALRRRDRAAIGRAIELAKQTSDLAILEQLYAIEKAPERRGLGAVLERVSLFEALGKPQAALALLERSLQTQLADDPVIWERQLTILRALSLRDEELAVLRRMEGRLGSTPSRVERRVELLLQLGRGKEALAALQETGRARDYAKCAQRAALAWSHDDAELSRELYREATTFEGAAETDFYRLAVLEQLHGDDARALSVSQQALSRFESLSMFDLALALALSTDSDVSASLLRQTESESHPYFREPRHVALRVEARHQTARKARARGRHEEAQLELSSASRDLSRARAAHPRDARLASLSMAQSREELTQALAADDKHALGLLYAKLANELSAREQVYLLHRLERDEEAVDVARSALRGSLSDADRQQLKSDAESLSHNMLRRLYTAGEVRDMGALRLYSGSVGAEYDVSRLGVLVGAEYTKLDAEPDSGLVLKRTHEVKPWLGLHVRSPRVDSRFVLAVDTRNGGSPRPSLDTRQTHASSGREWTWGARVNQVPTDTAALRALGASDEAFLSSVLPFNTHLYGAAGVTGSLYSTRNRSLLGAGVTGDLAIGLNLGGVPRPLRGNLRLLARLAPRTRRRGAPATIAELDDSPVGPAVPDSTTFVGAGATLAHGELTLPPIYGRSVAFILDGSAGALFPRRSLGYSARAGAGVSLFGEDLLSVSGQASNVVGTEPGQAVWSARAEYALGLW